MAKQIQKFRSDVRGELSNIVDNAQKISIQIEANYHPRKPFSKTLNNKTGEHVFYHPETKNFQTYFRDEDGVLYEISVFKR